MKQCSFLIICCFLSSFGANADSFRFQYRDGTQYRIVSHVDEQVFVNGLYSHSADILNKIAIEIDRVRGDSGYLKALFQTSERSHSSDAVYEWAREYSSEFWRDELGNYEIGRQYFMPVVRNVPLFPLRDLEPGDTWTSPGEEVHDLRDNFGIPDAFRFPVQVAYQYLGKESMDDGIYDLFAMEYTVFFRPVQTYQAEMYPVRISGFSRQYLYWDQQQGRPYHYSEEFDFIFDFNTGDTVEYIGTAEATVHGAQNMDKEQMADEIREKLDDSNIENTEVSIDDTGVTVSIENIQFQPDSALLYDVELEKIRKIGEILSLYPGRDILVTGHTALAGTKAGRQVLSEQRARAVGNYLLSLGVRNADEITTKGVGAAQPIADNSTQDGMRRNRRVEITILEN